MKKAWIFAVSTMLQPALAATIPLAIAATLVGCADENDPKTWVKRLDDPAQRAPAIKRLNQFYEDTLNKNKEQGNEAPEVKTLLDVLVEPLASVYTTATLDEKTRRETIKFLADTRDKRAFPAFTKAFNEFEAGKNDDDVKFSAQAVGSIAKKEAISDQALVDALWSCFSKFQPSKSKSSELVKALHDAILAVKSPSWGPKAVEKLGAPVKDPKDPTEARDQLQFWQLTSIRLIGELKYAAAAKPLVKILLTPTKADLRGAVNNALMKMPVEAETVLISALDGSDPELAAMGKDFGENAMHLAIVADTLTFTSRPKARDAVIDALAKATNNQQRTVMAQALYRFPSDAKVKEAFVAAYNKIPENTAVELLGGVDAHAALAQTSSLFYDSGMTKWLLKEIDQAKGEAADAMHLYALEAAIKLMGPDDVEAVGAAVKKYAPAPSREEQMYNNSKASLDKCQKDATCYVGLLDTPIPSSPDTAKYGAVKACWMAAIYGNDATRAALVEKVPQIRDGAVRLTLVEAIDALAPKGDEAAATKLEGIAAADVASGNKELIAADDALYKVANKLRARALP